MYGTAGVRLRRREMSFLYEWPTVTFAARRSAGAVRSRLDVGGRAGAALADASAETGVSAEPAACRGGVWRAAPPPATERTKLAPPRTSVSVRGPVAARAVTSSPFNKETPSPKNPVEHV